MPKDWSRRTRVKVAAVVAVLGLLVWADARWADSAECPSYGVQTDGRVATAPGELVDHGVACTR